VTENGADVIIKNAELSFRGKKTLCLLLCMADYIADLCTLISLCGHYDGHSAQGTQIGNICLYHCRNFYRAILPTKRQLSQTDRTSAGAVNSLRGYLLAG